MRTTIIIRLNYQQQIYKCVLNQLQIYQIGMFSTISRTIRNLSKVNFTNHAIRNITTQRTAQGLRYYGRYLIPVSSTFAYLYYLNNSRIHCSTQSTSQSVQQFQTRRDNMKLQTITQSSRSMFATVWSILCHTVRFFQLLLIFSPVILLYPLRSFDRTRGFWMDLFVKSVERAGVVWIKAFQYMSHRRDMIGPEMAEKFVHLRENAPQHSFAETKKNFEKLYGKKIQEVFEQFDQKPLASGSVSQVYKSTYKGKKVVVKVRHPGVDKHIQRDVNLMFFFSRFLSIFSKSFSIPVSEISMKKTLMDQIDFNNEKDNLLIFNEMFKGNKEVKFPLPFIQNTNEAFLVQTFVEGVPITYYETNKHPLNAVIARLGASTFFEMLMKNNFIHADCHGGNILVQIQEKSLTFFGQIWNYIKQKLQQIESYMVQSTLNSDILKKIYNESKIQQQKIRKIIKNCKQKAIVTLIDVGMVIRLDETDRVNFINFIKCVLHKDGEKCAQMIYNLSIFDGKKINKGKFNGYLEELRQLFSVLKNTTLQDFNGTELLIGMLNIIRDNNMKLQGEFATLLTNMLILEAMAKDLDKQINILKCAVPYFKYAEKQEQYVDHNIKELI